MLEPSRVIKKIGWRLVPFLCALYFVNFLDRVNVGFAALDMNAALGLTPEIFGWGAGIFFIGYFLCEVPSNLALRRYGARQWISRIMVSWGIVSTAMVFVAGPASFIALRFLLGVAEAGFFPGIVFYLGSWFPAAARGRVIALFFAAVPVSSVLGNPLSGIILGLGGLANLDGWRWLFLLEGIPAILLGFAVLVFLPDGPDAARWLAPDERDWLKATLAAEETAKGGRTFDLGAAFRHAEVWRLAAIDFGFVIALYGVAFWLPQIVAGFGLDAVETGFVSAIPYLAAALVLPLWAAHSDRTGERRRHLAAAGALAAAGLILSALPGSPVFAMAALSLAAIGIYAAIPVFWTLPGGFLSGTAAAGAIALINSIGNLGGFAGPYLMGWMRQATGGFAAGLALLGLAALAAGLLALRIRVPGRP